MAAGDVNGLVVAGRVIPEKRQPVVDGQRSEDRQGLVSDVDESVRADGGGVAWTPAIKKRLNSSARARTYSFRP